MSTRTRLLVTALAAWSLFVWVNRITNAWTGDEGLFSKLVSTVLAAALIVVAVAAVSEVWRRDARRAALLSKALAGGTIAVWVVRAPMILLGGWSIGFLVVHMVLAAASIALAVVVWRAVSADTEALDAGPGRPELPL
jgi:Na+/melibiose symporter-like transporter